MSVLVVGLSHHSAPVRLLERVVIVAADVPKALARLRAGHAVREAVVVSTCNRVEVYADVDKFHGGVAEISDVLAASSGLPLEAFSEYLYVHYEDRAVQHLFLVACGLDSMVVGEAQILGQLRSAYGVARTEGATGRVLHELFQHALRVGKRARSETGIDRAGASLVAVGLAAGAAALGSLAGRSVLIVGAGSMSALAGASLRRAGVGSVVVANRSAGNAARLADTLGGRAISLADLETALAAADVVVSCTGATGLVVSAELLSRAFRARAGRPIFLLDLALPRDIDPTVRGLPGVTLTDLESLRDVLSSAQAGRDVEAVRRIVAAEVAVFAGWQRAVQVAPTVVALRSKAADVVDAELLRLATRVPELDSRARSEVASTVRRVVDKLLHAPTVRVQELAEFPGGHTYADALRELFGLDPAVPGVVAKADLADPPDQLGNIA
jgi:glutamyl-tRNA reductase